MYRYLEVVWDDIDFAYAIVSALTQLWEDVVQNNKREDNETYSKVFKTLDERGVLKAMIVRMTDLKHLEDNMSRITIEVLRSDPNSPKFLEHWIEDDGNAAELSMDEMNTDYLNGMNIVFHKSADFSGEDHNGGHVYIDLLNGFVSNF